ncbi:MAG: hypothetical protein AAGD47_15175 [Pseudomonadota bacterium]
MSFPALWLCLAVLIVVAGVFWLRGQRDRFIAELRSDAHPLANGPMDKEFRKQFQVWLLQKWFSGPRVRSRGSDLLVFAGAAVLIGLGVISFVGGSS